MVSRRNINALIELGNQRRELVAQLADIDTQINRCLPKVYLEGWTWEELCEASSLSQGPLANRLKKLGLSKAGGKRGRSDTRRRPASAAPANSADTPVKHRDVRGAGGFVASVSDQFGGLLSWIPG
ncbi:hypothetical protein [Rhodococcus pyridinivorans]|uniref:hypothetical protein n=1 Tax=Rhodococcus pyridinivorans TaxID=103816 RepID=UPI0037CA1E16